MPDHTIHTISDQLGNSGSPSIWTRLTDAYNNTISILNNLENDYTNIVNRLIDIASDLTDGVTNILNSISGVNNKLGPVPGGSSSLQDWEATQFNNIYDNFSTTDTIIGGVGANVTTVADKVDDVQADVDSANARLIGISNNDTNSLGTVRDDITVLSDLTVTRFNAVDVDLNTLLERSAAALRAQATYTVIDGQDWDTAIGYTVAADFYLVTITSVPSSQGSQPSNPLRYPHLGWVSVLGPAGALDTIQQVDFANRVITSATVQPQGVVIFCKPGTLGTVQACINS